MSYLYNIYIDGKEKPVDSGDSIEKLPDVGDFLQIVQTRNHPQHRVVRVVDRSDDPKSGGQARCDIWVESSGRPNEGTY